MMIFANRQQSGSLLVQKLKNYQNDPNVIVLGLPRGGIPVAYEIAKRLKVPLDILLVRKLGVPGAEELAMGAIGAGGTVYLNDDIIKQFGIREQEIQQAIEREKHVLEMRNTMYRQGRKELDVADKTVILVDDGLATGATMRAAINVVRALDAQSIVVAVPVGPISTVEEITPTVDQLVCLYTPDPFYAVGAWYEDFRQISDEEVCSIIDKVANLYPHH
jgi:putative phosphoribosyl transferase